jgi:hypothetical protein
VLGWLANTYGGRAPVVVGGVVALLTGLGCALYLVRHEGLRLRLDREPGARLPVLVVTPVLAAAVEQSLPLR